MPDSSTYRHIVPAYHGTSSVRAEKILDEGFDLTRGEDGWFGAGAYLWEADAFLARVPAKRAVERDGGREQTLVCSIEIAKECLDLTTKIGKARYKRIIGAMFNELVSNSDLNHEYSTLPTRLADQFVIEFATEYLGLSFSVIRAITYHGNRHYDRDTDRLPVTQFPIRDNQGRLPANSSHALVDFGIHLTVKIGSSILNTEAHDGTP